MSTLSERRISDLLQPFLGEHPTVPSELYAKLSSYLDLLLRWNERTNLTAIRDPEEIVRRHFGESLFCATRVEPHIPNDGSFLDFGSGGGFPGVPTQLLLPGLHCCLAESQGKKATFQREVVRTLSLVSEVWHGRVEEMAEGRTFDCVALRAVDRMELAMGLAQSRVAKGGVLAVLGGTEPPLAREPLQIDSVPGGHSRVMYLYQVPDKV